MANTATPGNVVQRLAGRAGTAAEEARVASSKAFATTRERARKATADFIRSAIRFLERIESRIGPKPRRAKAVKKPAASSGRKRGTKTAKAKS